MGGLGPAMAVCGAVVLLWLVSTCWWVRLVPRIEQAHWWGWGPGHSGADACPLVGRAGSWDPRSIACILVCSAGSWAFWLAGTCTGITVVSRGLKAACLLVGCVPTHLVAWPEASHSWCLQAVRPRQGWVLRLIIWRKDSKMLIASTCVHMVD